MFSYLPTYQNAQMVLEDTKIRWQRHQVLWSYKVKCYILIYNRHTNEEVKNENKNRNSATLNQNAVCCEMYLPLDLYMNI